MPRVIDEIMEIVGKAIAETDTENNKSAFDFEDFKDFSDIRY